MNLGSLRSSNVLLDNHPENQSCGHRSDGPEVGWRCRLEQGRRQPRELYHVQAASTQPDVRMLARAPVHSLYVERPSPPTDASTLHREP
jgi:hypothetical protein